jgi:hypothetical protein
MWDRRRETEKKEGMMDEGQDARDRGYWDSGTSVRWNTFKMGIGSDRNFGSGFG